MKYRAEIDGLRALAVVPVIFFHAGFEFLSGGYVGVDVFFVISGYLITTIILREMEEGRFSLLHFYERRARRILPALFLVVLCCLPFAWMWLTPLHMKDFAQSLAAVATFSSNLLFWRESGYFGTASELKPLLHTWSLAVEEQYYILFPLFLLILWRFGKKIVLVMFVLIFVVSLVWAQWGAYHQPWVTFFVLQTRGWEIMLGAFCAFYLIRFPTPRSNMMNQSMSAAGLLLIGLSVFVFDANTPTPSVYTLVPTVGAVLLILFANERTIANRLLSSSPFVGIGAISYSAYLWHQPVLVFSRHYVGGVRLGVGVSIGLIALTLVLAFISWKFVETPFRRKQKFTRTTIFASSILVAVIIASVGVYGHVSDGLKSRFERVAQGDIGHDEFHAYIDTTYVDCRPQIIADNALYWQGFLRCKQTRNGTPDLIILGDSHAEHLFLGLAEEMTEKNVAFYIRGNRPYLKNEEFRDVFEEIAGNETSQTIILTMHFVGYVYANATELYEELGSTVSALQGSGNCVILVSDIPLYKTDPANCVFAHVAVDSFSPSSHCAMSLDAANKQKGRYDDVLHRLSRDHKIPYIDLYPAICAASECSMVRDGMVWYRDNNHLNMHGSRIIGRHISSFIGGEADNF